MTSLTASTLRMLSTTRINWIANIAIPDSIMMKIMDRTLASVLPMLRVRSPKVGTSSRDNLRILSTIKPVTTAFTVKEMARLVIVAILPQLFVERSSGGAM